MNANFKEFDKQQKSSATNKRKMNTSERDYFELLSAYLDGEVTASERQHVQYLLDNDPKTQQLYTRLLKLRDSLEHLPIPTSEQSAQELSEQVFQRLERQRQWQRILFISGAAIAATMIGAILIWLPGSDSPTPQIVKSPTMESDSEPLMIALNRPVVKIPPAALPAIPKASQSTKDNSKH
ncbi:MAG: anti-sigma factor family protein [Microcystaceae cyanobacterium]